MFLTQTHHTAVRKKKTNRNSSLTHCPLWTPGPRAPPSLQARDEVITVLKADKIDLAVLEAKYGFVTPQKVLQSLQRDAIQKGDGYKDDIYEKPMVEVRGMIQVPRDWKP